MDSERQNHYKALLYFSLPRTRRLAWKSLLAMLATTGYIGHKLPKLGLGSSKQAISLPVVMKMTLEISPGPFFRRIFLEKIARAGR